MIENHCVVHATLLHEKIKKRYSPLNSVHTMCDFINYDTDYMCLRALKRKYIWSDLHFIS